jgi:hypothetical protein
MLKGLRIAHVGERRPNAREKVVGDGLGPLSGFVLRNDFVLPKRKKSDCSEDRDRQ